MWSAPRSTSLLVVTGLLAALTAGCADDPERGPITMLRNPDTTRDRGLEAVVDRWNEAHPDEQVEWITLGEGTDNERTQLLEVVASGQQYDVLALDMIWIAEFARAGYLRELDPGRFQLDQFLDGPRSAVQIEGKTWAVPSNANAALLYYRADLLEEVGEPVPETWQELMAAAAKIISRYDVFGYAGQYDRYEGLVVNTFEAIWAEGGDVLANDDQGNHTVVIDEQAARDGLRWLVSGVDQGLIPQAARSYREEDAIQAFQKGQLAFMRGWPNAYGRFADPTESTVHDSFGVTTIAGPSVLGGHNLAVSHASKHPETALDFIEFATNYENQRRLFVEHSFPPSRSAVYHDTSLLESHAYLPELRDAMLHARPRPAIAQYAYLSQAISDHVYQAMFESDQPADVTVQATVDALELELQALLS